MSRRDSARRTRGPQNRQSVTVRAESLISTAVHNYDANSNVSSAGSLVSLPNLGSAGGQMDVTAGTLVEPVAKASLNGHKAVSFTTTQRLASSLAESAWNFVYDGTGVYSLMIFTPTSLAATGCLYATLLGAAQWMDLRYNAGGGTALRNFKSAGGATVCDLSPGTLTVNVPNKFVYAYSSALSPNIATRVNSTVATSAQLTTPGTGDSGILTVGMLSGGAWGASIDLARLLFWNRRLSSTEESWLLAYVRDRYGA
jgi:hypothetical protein